jgi:hypothetical protein
MSRLQSVFFLTSDKRKWLPSVEQCAMETRAKPVFLILRLLDDKKFGQKAS